MLFRSDLELFAKEFPTLKIKSITYHSPFMYVLSGGVSRSAMLPYFMYNVAKAMEWLCKPFSKQLGLFCTVEVEKI